MSNAINVDPDRLDIFREDLQKTPAMLEDTLGHNRELIKKTQYQIDSLLDSLNRKRNQAQMELDQAQAALASAQMASAAATLAGGPMPDLSSYQARINAASARLSKITSTISEVRNMQSNYNISAEQYKREEELCSQDYININNEGMGMLTRYADIARRTEAIIKEDLPGGLNQTGTNAAISAAAGGLGAGVGAGIGVGATAGTGIGVGAATGVGMANSGTGDTNPNIEPGVNNTETTAEVGTTAGEGAAGAAMGAAAGMSTTPWKLDIKLLDEKLTNQGLGDSYKKVITNKIINATPLAQQVFMKNVPEDSIKNGKHDARAAHYDPNDKKIRMNFVSDEKGAWGRGAGFTYFHEHGHLIDHVNKRVWTSNDADFKIALKKDYDTFMEKYAGEEEAFKSISSLKDFRKSTNCGLQDIFDGLSNGKIKAPEDTYYCTHGSDYWEDDPNNVNVEAFANFFDAQFDKEKLETLTKYFPTATKEFDRLLGGLI